MRYLLAFVILWGWCGAVHAQALVVEGRPAGEIVLAANPDLRERLAARELGYWIKQITGAELPLLAMPSPETNTKLFVGRKWATAFADDLKALNDSEGFAIRRKGANVYVFGAQPAGTLYGAWRLLEENTDLIWARPNEEFGAVYSRTPHLTLTQTDLREKPVFSFRSWSMPGGVPSESTNLWQARNGCNSKVSANWFDAGHYLAKEMNRALWVGGGFMYGFLGKYKETNPEFFPFVDGRRVLSNHAQPCFTNPAAVRTLIRDARETLQHAPAEVNVLDCGNEDTWRCCECPECLKPLKLPDGTLLAPKSPSSEKDPLFRSTQMYMFLNQVADDLSPDYPRLKIPTLAYIFAAEYPVVKVHPSIQVLFAPYPTCNMRFPILSQGPGQPGTWATRFQQWGVHETLSFYEYYGVGYFNAMADTAAVNLRDLQRFGGIGMNSEALQDVDQAMEGIGNFAEAWDANALEMWTISRLMWNPDQDVAALRKRYIARAFREAAPPMEQFFAIIHDSWHNRALKHAESCHSGRNGVFARYLVDTELEKPARALLVEAQRTAQHPHSQRLVSGILQRFDAWTASLGRLIAPRIGKALAGNSFDAPDWERAGPIDDFKLPRHWQQPTAATHKTEVRMLHDGTHLYFRIVAADPAVNKAVAAPAAAHERFPLGDHAEVYLSNKAGKYFFAMDINGNKYDSKNWDRHWNSHWTVATRKTGAGWEAVAAIPLADLGFDPGNKETSLSAVFARIFDHGAEKPEENTYKGVVLHGQHVWSPLIIEP